MSVLFITHDLAVVGEIADYVVVMRNGEIREQGPAKRVFENPQDPYTKALLQCRPRLDRRPVRLPVIEDFMDGGAHAMNLTERTRGISASDPIILDVKNLGKDFYSREGLFGRRKFEAVKDVSFRLPKGKTLGLVGESGSGKTTVGLTLMRLHEASAGEAIFEGKDILAMSQKRVHAVQAADPDHLPESVRFAQPALHRRAHPDRADGDPRDRRQRAGAHRARVRAPAEGRPARKSRSTSIRTSSPAVSGSGSRSRAA